jgi:hypothetical protein
MKVGMNVLPLSLERAPLGQDRVYPLRFATPEREIHASRLVNRDHEIISGQLGLRRDPSVDILQQR